MQTLCVIGTRPEAIKLAPVVRALRAAGHDTTVCCTGQHDVADLLAHFLIEPQVKLISHGATTIERMADTLKELNWLFDHRDYDRVIVQGDTTSVYAAANVAFLRGIPLVHVEAGLRTYDLQAPFPEEYFRRCVSMVANLHCAPTPRAANHLIDEGIDGRRVVITGQTGIDALDWTITGQEPFRGETGYVLVTCHRQENRVRKEQITQAVLAVSRQWPVIYVQHPNPAAQLELPEPIRTLPPQEYPAMCQLLAGSKAVLTDSGGLQEEACFLQKPTIVLRQKTERPEAVDYGTAFVAGTHPETVVEKLEYALDVLALRGTPPRWTKQSPCPYGDGQAAVRVVRPMEAMQPYQLKPVA